MKILKKILEQVLHILIGFGIVAVFLIPIPAVAGAVAGLYIALLREWEQRPVERWGDFFLDVGMTVLGGLAAGFLIGGYI